MDHAADEVHEQPKEVVINDVHAEAQGFASGPPRYISFDGICSSCGSHSLGKRATYFLNYIIFS